MEKTKPEKSSKLLDNKVMRTEFELHHFICRNHFKRRLQERCRNANITGYVIYKNHGRNACGVMEGLPEDINELKMWISCRYIPETFNKGLIFSAYEICRNPDRQEFCERTSVPDEPLLADIYKEDMMALQEEAEQKAKAEAEEKTKPIKICLNPDRQEFSERTSVPDNEPLLADIHEEDIKALQEEAEQKAKAEAEEKTKPEKSSKLFDNKVMRTEFELHHIMRRNHFKQRLLERCRNANITGYVIYKDHGRNACGVMEGLPEDINELKMWISCRYIPEIFNKGLIFSAYEICRNPDRQEFCERTSVPDEPLLADIHEKDIMALQEEPEQKAKAEAEEKTKPIKICWNPDSQEFSERTSVPDNEPLLADIHEKDIMALQEEAEQKAKAEAEEKTKPEKSSKLFDNKVMRTEFELHHIMRRNHFKQRLLERCRNANITGYVIYKDHGRNACGVMEGLPEDINELKIWISCRYIPEIFNKRLIFSAYEICWNPDRQKFCERTSVPDNEPLLADIYEKDILALQEKAAQKAKADKRAKQQAEAEEKTKPIKLRWYPDGQEFSEKTSVPDNEPLLADIYEEDMMALQEAEQKAMADKRAKQEAEAEAAAESEAESKSESEAAAESEASK